MYSKLTAQASCSGDSPVYLGILSVGEGVYHSGHGSDSS
jgi:hypothetical protein